MNKHTLLFTLLLSYFYSMLTPAQNAAIEDSTKITTPTDSQYPEINWSDLMPPNWDSVKKFSQFNFYKFKDGDPAAEVELKKMRAIFYKAPIEPKMNDRKISISGFMIPLNKKDEPIKDFLLVAFVGTCIHEAPPAANQTIHVTVTEPLQGVKAMAPITIKGVINTAYIDTPMGGAGYRMENAQVDPHVTKRCLFAPTCD